MMLFRCSREAFSLVGLRGKQQLLIGGKQNSLPYLHQPASIQEHGRNAIPAYGASAGPARSREIGQRIAIHNSATTSKTDCAKIEQVKERCCELGPFASSFISQKCGEKSCFQDFNQDLRSLDPYDGLHALGWGLGAGKGTWA